MDQKYLRKNRKKVWEKSAQKNRKTDEKINHKWCKNQSKIDFLKNAKALKIEAKKVRKMDPQMELKVPPPMNIAAQMCFR